MRETLHGELSASRRARQHRKVAVALEARHVGDLDAVVTALATHWAEASAGGDPGRAIELAARAGAQATERGAWENAIRWHQSVLELIDGDPAHATQRRQTLVALAGTHASAGEDTEAWRAIVEAATMSLAGGDTDTLCAALTVKMRSVFGATTDFQGIAAEKVGLLRSGLAVPSLGDARRADLLSELSTELMFVPDNAGRRAALDELWGVMPTLSEHDHASLLQNTALCAGASTRDYLQTLDALYDGAISVARPHQARWLHYGRTWIRLQLSRRDAAAYRGRPFATLDFELGLAEAGSFRLLEQIPNAVDLDRVQLGPTADVIVLSVHYQIAQKLHACSEVPGEGSNPRVHDLYDILLLCGLAEGDGLALTLAACEDTFRRRHRHSWPPLLPDWPDWPQLRESLDVPDDARIPYSDARSDVEDLIARVARA